MKKKDFIIITVITIFILGIISFIKGIYPFGNYSYVWGDMYDQIMPYYFNMYDAIRGNTSLLQNFTTGSGVNFFGIMAYYITSPLSLILLLFPRSSLYGAISIIIDIKIILSSITALYFIKTYFKKLDSSYSILLALLYSFSNYMLINYQITGWIDVMILFPLLTVGLKKLLDKESPIMYIVTLTLSLIFNFYITFMVIIFIFLVSNIYLLIYKKKEERKSIITSLGITTILSIFMSLFIVIPTYIQISQSSRIAFKLSTLLNSKTGPITEKLVLYLYGGILYAAIIFLLKDYKKNKKFLKFYIPTMLLLFIPLIVEPVHKLWHFGSFASWPYRFGFINALFLVIGAAYYLENNKLKEKNNNLNKIISISITIICSLVLIFISIKYKDTIEHALYTLSLSKYTKVKIAFLLLFILSFIPCIANFIFYNRHSKKLIIGITIISIFALSYINLGIDEYQAHSLEEYNDYITLGNDRDTNNNYRLKQDLDFDEKIFNSGMITNYNTLDQFSSLSSKQTLETMKKLGYSSYWVNTNSRGSNLFIDVLLSNKYLISSKTPNDFYSLKKEYKTFNLYELKYVPSYGYLLNNESDIDKYDNSFERSNTIYKDITGSDDLFTIYGIENNYKKGTITKEIEIKDKSTLYIEIFRELDNILDRDNYNLFKFYINDTLLELEYKDSRNNVLELGTYENEKITIKIELSDDAKLDHMTLGLMNNQKLIDFLNNNHLDIDINYKKNKATIKYDSTDAKTLFIPITYSDNIKAKNNNNDIKIKKVYGNYIAIDLQKGINNIEITYIPKTLKISIIFSIITLLITIIILKTNIYNLLINSNYINNITYPIYNLIYILIIGLYVILTIVFFLSFIIKF